MRCPVCRAELTSGPQCRRCRADLSLLFAIQHQRQQAVALALALAAGGHGDEVLALADQADQLQHGEDCQLLRALGHLLRGDFAAAWECYQSVRRPPPATGEAPSGLI
jgi:hypothetical protein